MAADGVAARQLEAFLAEHQLAEGRTAWTGPSVLSYRAWIRSLWAEHYPHDERQLLTPGQVRGLWRRIVERSPVSDRLIGSHNVVQWAIEAAQRLRDWQVDVGELRAGADNPDFASFLGWANDYTRQLADAGWLDPGEAEVVLRTSPTPLRIDPEHQTIWADFEPLPGQRRLGERLQRDGYRLEAWQPEGVNRRCHRIGLADTSDELRAAGRWAADRLTADPNRRLAIVVPGLGRRREEVSRILDGALGPEDRAYLGCETAPAFVDLSGEPADRSPLIGSALTALELLSPRGRFATLSRWLRSPFFAKEPQEMDARGRLEVELRLSIDAQLRFLEAFHSGGLARRLRATVPSLAEVLTEGVRIVETAPKRATPTVWVDVWRRLLRHLGWQGDASSSPALISWEAALNELAQLTPVLGQVSVTEALGDLRSILAQPRRSGPMPLSGVFVVPRAEDVGPGYDGIWVTGLTDSRWPATPRPNPILPLTLQRAHGMPHTAPAESLEHSQKTTRRVVGRAPEVVLSWPSLLHDYPTQPSPLITVYPETSKPELLREVDAREARRLFGSRPRHSVADAAPPITGRRLHGGARTLDLQSSCPLRAFLESRLAARPLETVRRGVSARQRGIATHRAMELLLRELPRRGEVAQWQAGEQQERVYRCVARALGEIFGDASGLLRVEFELEAERMNAILSEFLATDLRRPEFEVSAVEERLPVRVGEMELHCRIDRLDTIPTDGSARRLAIIDYKTGRRGTPSDWLRDRPLDVQLPLYTLAVGDAVSAAVIAVLRPEGVQYKGMWSQKGAFPGRPTVLPDGRTWSAQLEVWREQLEMLVGEFAAGDVRVFKNELTPAEGLFAPLTRVYEQVALATGWLEPWDPE